MKTLAVALCCAPLAVLAQSSVTIFGTIDMNITHARSGDDSLTMLDQGGNKVPSRFGLRGVEDLGDGLSAGFWLETAVLPDTGLTQGAFFGRRSTLSLSSRTWGELRLGRDYVPTFWNISSFSPFGTVGVAGSSNIILGWPAGYPKASTMVRASNSIGYHLPRTASGLYGQAMYALPEGVEGARYTGGRIGFATGPWDIAAAYGQTPTQGAKYKVWSLGGSYDVGPMKLYANYNKQQLLDDSQANVLLGIAAKVGPGQLLASIAHSDRKGPGVDGDDARQYGVGYVYPLSRRTDIYTTYSLIQNKGNADFATAGAPAGVPGRRSTGVQVGMTHRF